MDYIRKSVVNLRDMYANEEDIPRASINTHMIEQKKRFK